MRVLFIPSYFDGLHRDTGSARIRAAWPAKAWSEATLYDGTQSLTEYDLIVFQKTYKGGDARRLITTASRLRDQGLCRLAFDLCDPDFLDPTMKRRMFNALPSFDFGVAPTQPLTDWLGQWLPSYCIPDCIDFSDVLCQATPSSIPTLVWGGYLGNDEPLDVFGPIIDELDLYLEPICPEGREPIPWNEFWDRVAHAGSIFLNHRPAIPPWLYKSDNKTILAWAHGMAVARDPGELRELVRPGVLEEEMRSAPAKARAYDISLAVKLWKEVAQEWARRKHQ